MSAVIQESEQKPSEQEELIRKIKKSIWCHQISWDELHCECRNQKVSEGGLRLFLRGGNPSLLGRIETAYHNALYKWVKMHQNGTRRKLEALV